MSVFDDVLKGVVGAIRGPAFQRGRQLGAEQQRVLSLQEELAAQRREQQQRQVAIAATAGVAGLGLALLVQNASKRGRK